MDDGGVCSAAEDGHAVARGDGKYSNKCALEGALEERQQRHPYGKRKCGQYTLIMRPITYTNRQIDINRLINNNQ